MKSQEQLNVEFERRLASLEANVGKQKLVTRKLIVDGQKTGLMKRVLVTCAISSVAAALLAVALVNGVSKKSAIDNSTTGEDNG